MSARCVPVTPEPRSDELLSSWLERTAVLYSVDYVSILAIVAPEHFQRSFSDWTFDVDTDATFRRAVALWSGRDAATLPRAFSIGEGAGEVLPPAARLSFCPSCWDDDVEAGRSPFVRRTWALWAEVACPTHRCWLSARRPRAIREGVHRGWSALWRTQPRWAAAFEIRCQRSGARLVEGLHGCELTPPPSEFVRFEACRRVAEDRGVAVHFASPRFAGLRHAAKAALCAQSGPRVAMDELDISWPGDDSTRPLWLANRIATIALATEWLQIVRRGAPLFPEVRPLLSAAAERWRPAGRACAAGRSMGRLKKGEIFPPMAADAGGRGTRVSRMVRLPIGSPGARY